MIVVWCNLNGVVITSQQLDLRPLHFNLVVRWMLLARKGSGGSGTTTFTAFYLKWHGTVQPLPLFVSGGLGVS